MNATGRRWLWSLVVLVAVGLALRTLVNFPWRETFAVLVSANAWLLLAATLVNLLSPLAKGSGWYVVLRRVGPCRFWVAQEANLVGTAVNSVSVGVTGEAARLGVVVRREGLPARAVAWSIAASRAAEGLALACFLVLAPSAISLSPAVRALRPAAVLIGAGLLFYGLRGRRKFPLAVPTAFGVANWGVQWATYHAVLQATLTHVSLSASFTALIVANLGGLLRLTPANLGVTQAALVAALLPFNTPVERAVAAGLALQAIQVLPILALAAIVSLRAKSTSAPRAPSRPVAKPLVRVRRLIINADDFGLSEGVNRGIIEAHQAGSVTSASLLPNLPAFDHAVQRAREAPQLGVGLHFNLTTGAPVSSADMVPSLCDARTGQFHSLTGLVGRALAGKIRPGEVARECEAQITKLRDAGVSPMHLDSHLHVHLLPGVLDAVLATARAAGIANVRVPFERAGRVATSADAAAEQLLLRLAYRLAGGNGARRSTVDRFYGSSLFRRPDFRVRLLGLLDALEPGTAELMVHPGYVDAEILRWDWYTWDRERELYGLTDPSVRERLHREDIALTRFGGAAPLTNGRKPVDRRASPRISMIIPAYNEAEYLPRLLDSIDVAHAVSGADPGALEVIVADNASTDRTPDIARSRGCRVVTERKRVIGAVRNTGAAQARGAVVAFVDADSVIHPQTFRAIETALGGGCVGGATGVTTERHSWQISVTFSVLGLWCRLSGWDTGVVFCRRADFEAAGRFDESLLFAEDLAFYRALCRLGRSRGQRFVRLPGVRTVTSTRKFEEFGQLRWPLENCRVILLSALRSPRARQLVEAYWYKVRA